MLSSLARGYGSWTGDFDLYSEERQTTVGYPEPHRHGITIPSHYHPAGHSMCVEKADGKLDLPKTYVTRKGALLLFSAPEDDAKKPTAYSTRFVRRKSEMIDLSLKLGTMERLSLSVLQYGEEDYDRETSSISDKNNKLFMKFLRKSHSEDLHSQPGGDLRFYLRDLKSRASGRFHGSADSSSGPKSEEFRQILRELEEAWCRMRKPSATEVPVNTNNSFLTNNGSLSPRQRVLSSKKLRESLKSATYLGRPFSAGSAVSPTDWEDTKSKLSDMSSHHSVKSSHSRTGIWVRSETTTETEPISITTPTRRFASSRSNSAKSRVTPPAVFQEDVKSADHGASVEDVGEADIEEEDAGEEKGWVDHVVVEVDRSRRNETRQSSIYGDLSDATHPLIPQYSGTLDGFHDNDKVTMTDDESSTDDEEWLEKMLRAREFSPLSTPSLRSISPFSRSTSRLDAAIAAYKANLEDVDAAKSILSGLERRITSKSPAPEHEATSQDNGQDRTAEVDMQDQLSKSESLPEDKAKTLSESESDDKEEQDLQTLVSTQPKDSQSEQDKDKMGDGADVAENDGQALGEDVDVQVLQDVQMAQTDDGLEREEDVIDKQEEDKTDVPQETETSDTVAMEEEIVLEAVTQESDDYLTLPEEQVLVTTDSDLKEKEPKKEIQLETVVSDQKVKEDEKSSETKVDDSLSKDKKEVVEIKTKPPSPKQTEEKIQSPIQSPVPSPVPVITEEEKPEVKVFEPTPPTGKRPKQKSSSRRSKSDKKPAAKVKDSGKYFVKALDISSVQPDGDAEQNVEKIVVKPEKPRHQKKPPARHVETKLDKTKADVMPEHMAEVMQRRSASKSAQELEEEIMQMQEAISGALAGPTMEMDMGEGLSSEELVLAQEALQERMKEAKLRMDEVGSKTPKVEKPKLKPLPGKKGRKKAAQPSEDEKRDIRREREEIKERQSMEKLKRMEEVRLLQEQIANSEAERQARDEAAARQAKELQEEMEALEQQANAIRQAEEDAHIQLQLARRADREERERRRKEDLEKKKQQAMVRREKQKAMMEEARNKEMNMLMQITDTEMKKQLEEEDRAKREDEERMAQERYEEELIQAQLAAEEEEHRLRELEKEAEEEAMRRLVDEREQAERQKQALEEKQQHLQAEERKKQEFMIAKEKKLEKEKRKKDKEEEQLREEQRQRLLELQRMEAEARENMRQEIDRRREWALMQREKNLENRMHLDKIRHGQGMTKPWVFSYFINWPRETYNRRMGQDSEKKPGFRAKPKPKPAPPTENKGDN